MALPTSLPSPKMPDPLLVPSLRWGVLGPGWIATQFARTVLKHTQQRITAVASTSLERASAFAEQFGIETVYGAYDDLYADPNVDVIYIATRQHLHAGQALAAIAAGKHVLIEKPITTLPADARAIRDAARKAGVLVMEAMWMSYLPQSDVIRQLVADNVLGGIQFVQADLGQNHYREGSTRLFEREGGGASHDMGIYPMSLISSVLPDMPIRIDAIGSVNEVGIDTELHMRLLYENGARAIAYTTSLAYTQSAAWIDGENASLEIALPFPSPPSMLRLFERSYNPKLIAEWSEPTTLNGHEGLCYQANYFAHFVGLGLTDSPIRSLDDSVRDIEILTEARHQIGAYYPGEVKP
ncbi:MAG: Gfo/Idh/MocA family protein [Microbacteriaceae bacterium]